MGDLSNGMLVKHASLGVGKVVALEVDAVHVFFPSAEKRFATKLKLPAAHAFLRTDGVPPDPWLQGLTAFTLDDETRRYALATTWLTHEQAVAQFMAAYPQGFADPRHLSPKEKDARAPRWRAAHEAWVRTLGAGQAERLLEDGDLDELVRRVVAVEKPLAALHDEDEADALSDALGDNPPTRLFFERLLELLSVPSPNRARFDKLFAAASSLPGVDGSAWWVATLLPFLAAPSRHVCVTPEDARAAAARLGCDLRWADAPNWATYSALRAFSAKLLEELKAIGARDLVDVETFLHHTAVTRSRPARTTTSASPRAGAVRPRGGAVRQRRPAAARSSREKR